MTDIAKSILEQAKLHNEVERLERILRAAIERGSANTEKLKKRYKSAIAQLCAKPDGADSAFPERDLSKSAQEQGLFNKFFVSRTDGSSAAGEKHAGCKYFVLDMDHDQFAIPAVQAYAVACQATYPILAQDIFASYGKPDSAEQVPVAYLVERHAFRASPHGQDAEGHDWLEECKKDDPGAFPVYAAPLNIAQQAPIPAKEKIAPVQGYSAGIPWHMHLEAYDAYCKRYGSQQALIEGGCRGGFGTGELDMFIPGWRERLSKFAILQSQITELQEENARLKGSTI